MTPLANFFAFGTKSFIESFVLLFAVIDPIGATPIFLALTKDHEEHRQRILRQAMVVTTTILAVFAVFGWLIFDIFGITINDFRIAGGIILFIVAVDQLQGTGARSKGFEPSDIAVFPLATPLLAGPGAISTVVIISGPPYSPFLALVAILGNAAITYLILSRGSLIGKALGRNGTSALSKIMALLIASLAVSFVVIGVTNIVGAL